MKKFTIFAAATTLIIIVGGILLVSKGQSPNTNNYPMPADLTYYWGEGCPHCEIVEEFISTWEKKDTIKIDKKEVWNTIENAKELKARYIYCNVPESQMGVPLLFTPEGTCFSGDTPIIDYLKNIK